MSDRQRVVYKTPLFRFLETASIVLSTLAVAAACFRFFPEIPSSYAIVGAAITTLVVIPQLGSRIALRRGAPLLSRDARSRRYLGELGPVGLVLRQPQYAAMTGTRRFTNRSLRRR